MTARRTSYEVGDIGPHQGRIIERRGIHYTEVLVYYVDGVPQRNDARVFIFSIGPRGGIRSEEAYKRPGELGRKAAGLQGAAMAARRFIEGLS